MLLKGLFELVLEVFKFKNVIWKFQNGHQNETWELNTMKIPVQRLEIAYLK